MSARSIVVARTDRLGDFLLTLPVFGSLRAAWPEARIGAIVSEANAELAAAVEGVDAVHAWRRGQERRLAAELREAGYETALVLFNKTPVNRALARAGIARRVGPASKLAQVWLTERLRQRRAEGRKHEADCNLDLLAPLGVPPLAGAPSAIRLPEPARERAERILSERGLAGRPFAILHPGHGGSALPWRSARYAELADRLVDAGVGVLLTGGPGEEALLEKAAARAARRPPTYVGAEGLLVFAAVVARAGVLVSASTGPMHLAAALGAPVVSLFCPRFACLPSRWGPRTEKASVLLPPVDVVCDLCLGPNCPHYDCMDKITPARAYTEASRWLRGG